ncbi:MAG: hypothetical protein CVV47_13505 [Spirochaetae bacterium HGW-Spirochaetae-3]|jgi:hypothetical protein|nr:MAG: hypothetical protein CVV47_13505 [Spirochaetae bacterium HGW-Spirochaetae-3]
MKYFYLELNPIIVAGSKLKKLNWKKADVYTSSWAISEQLINLKEENYPTIRASFKLIDELKIRIDWENNVSKMFSAFDLKHPVLTDEAAIKSQYESVLKASTFSDLPTQVLKTIGEFKKMREASNWHMGVMNHFTPEMKEVLRVGIAEDEMKMLSMTMVLNCIQGTFQINEDMLLSRYTGRLDRFLFAQAKYFQKKSDIKKNDWFDLEHFKYIQNEITYMVSDDIFVKWLDYKKVYSVDEFLEFMS